MDSDVVVSCVAIVAFVVPSATVVVVVVVVVVDVDVVDVVDVIDVVDVVDYNYYYFNSKFASFIINLFVISVFANALHDKTYSEVNKTCKKAE